LRLSAVARYFAQDYSGALERWERLARRGWPRPMLMAAMARTAAASRALPATDPTTELDRALQTFDRYLDLRPADANALIGRTMAAWVRGQWLGKHGEDARTHYRAALPLLDRALAAAPRNSQLLLTRAQLHGAIAEESIRRGEPALASVAAGAADMEQAIARAPTDATLWRRLGLLLAAGVRASGRRTKDEAEFAARAKRALLQATTHAPNHFEAWVDLANLAQHLSHSARTPQDARSLLSEGLANCDRGLALNPDDGLARSVRGGLLRARAALALNRGEDPRADFEAAAAEYRWLVEHHPEKPQGHERLADLLISWGVAEHSLERDGSAPIAEARATLDRLVAGHPNGPAAWHARGAARSRLARLALAIGRDPTQDHRGALDDFRRSVAIDPSQLAGWIGVAREASILTLGSPPPPDVAELHAAALAASAEAIQRHPASADAWAARANALYLHWRRLARDGGEHRDRLEALAAAYDKCVELRPSAARDLAARREEVRQRLGR